MFNLRNVKTGDIVDTWGTPPNRLDIPNVGVVHAIQPGWQDGDFAFEQLEMPDPPPPPPDKDQVNMERNRRMKTFPFNGVVFDFGPESITNIQGAGTLALGAIMLGAEPNDLRWANPDSDFAWIAADNSSVTMDAQTMFDFAKTAAAWRSAHIHAARKIKDMKPIPKDFKSDAYWP